MILWTRISDEEKKKYPPISDDLRQWIEESKGSLSPNDCYFDEARKKWLPYQEDDFDH